MNTETSILDRIGSAALRAVSLYAGILEKHYESEDQVPIVLKMNNSKAFIENSVCS